MPMPALVYSMPMPSYEHYYKRVCLRDNIFWGGGGTRAVSWCVILSGFFQHSILFSAWYKENLPAVCEDSESITPGGLLSAAVLFLFVRTRFLEVLF